MRKEQGTGAGSAIYMLVVSEYLDTKKKPFLFIENDTIYFGSCEHF